MKYEPVIGLEIHVQAKTKSKMFSPVAADYFGDEPNSHIDPYSIGLPGVLPVPNAEAIDQCLRIALALECKINKYSRFDRKNYFYPDLPKGYQISQYQFPFGYEGFLEIAHRFGARVASPARGAARDRVEPLRRDLRETLARLRQAGVDRAGLEKMMQAELAALLGRSPRRGAS